MGTMMGTMNDMLARTGVVIQIGKNHVHFLLYCFTSTEVIDAYKMLFL